MDMNMDMGVRVGRTIWHGVGVLSNNNIINSTRII